MNTLNPFPVTSTEEELKKTNNVIGKEHFKNNINDVKLTTIDTNPTKSGKDKITCNICGKSYTRYNKTKHCKTKHHQFCTKMNTKWRNIIIQ